MESRLVVGTQLGPSFSQAALFVLDYMSSHNALPYRKTVTLNWYWTHAVTKFGLQGSWITGTCHYIRHLRASSKIINFGSFLLICLHDNWQIYGVWLSQMFFIVNTRNIFPLALSKVPVFGDFWSAFYNIQSECRKIWTRKTPNTDTFHALILTINFIRQGVNKLFQSRNKSELSRSSIFSSSNYMFARAIWYKLPKCIFKNSKIARKKNESNFKIFKNHEGDLYQELSEPNMWLLINYTKPTNTLYWNYLTAGNCRSVSGQIQNRGWLQNNTVNGAM